MARLHIQEFFKQAVRIVFGKKVPGLRVDQILQFLAKYTEPVFGNEIFGLGPELKKLLPGHKIYVLIGNGQIQIMALVVRCRNQGRIVRQDNQSVGKHSGQVLVQAMVKIDQVVLAAAPVDQVQG